MKSCYIGITPDGLTPSPNATGILVNQTNDCVIGGSTKDRNVISGNSSYGINVVASTMAYIQSNLIGTDFKGTTAIPGTDVGVFFIQNCAGSVVGGRSAEQRNVICGGSTAELFVDTDGGIEVKGNYIGTDITGKVALGASNLGIYLLDSDNVQIGGDAPGEGNVIYGHAQANIYLVGSPTDPPVNVQILGNLIGLNALGTGRAPSANDIQCDGPLNTVIGDGTTAGRNVISGAGIGISLDSTVSGLNTIMGNWIGTDGSGAQAAGNTQGIVVSSRQSEVHIGGQSAGQGNVISGNGEGMELSGDEITVEGNLVGLNAQGTGPLGNDFGIIDDSGQGGFVFLGTPSAGNTICGNKTAGVLLNGCTFAQVCNNYIGLLPSGVPIGNGDGIRLVGAAISNTIGGTASNQGNVISGNRVNGINALSFAGQAPSNNVVFANLIGLDKSGKVAVPNQNGIVLIGGSHQNLIGSTGASTHNFISGNRGVGIYLGDAHTSSNSIQGNFVGLGPTGLALPNGAGGLALSFGASSNMIGTSAPNNISSNKGQGIHIYGGGTTLNQIQGNLIQNNALGQVLIDSGASGNLVNGNTIRTSVAPAAVVVKSASSTGNNLRMNTYFVAGPLLVDLVGNDGPFGVTPNDNLDADTGPNNLQNNADITSAVKKGSSVTVSGQLLGKPNTVYNVDLFYVDANAANHAGRIRYLNSVVLQTSAAGKGTFTGTYPITGSPIGICTQVADANSGDTSEFGANRLF